MEDHSGLDLANRKCHSGLLPVGIILLSANITRLLRKRWEKVTPTAVTVSCILAKILQSRRLGLIDTVTHA